MERIKSITDNRRVNSERMLALTTADRHKYIARSKERQRTNAASRRSHHSTLSLIPYAVLSWFSGEERERERERVFFLSSAVTAYGVGCKEREREREKEREREREREKVALPENRIPDAADNKELESEKKWVIDHHRKNISVFII
jgi:hypothetical protein